jgi:hypothetical protein
MNSGSSEPSSTVAGMLWADSTASPYTVKIRDHTDSSWAELFKTDGSLVSPTKIGTATTVTPHVNADDFVIDLGAADSGMTIASTATGNIYFADAESNFAGTLLFTHSTNTFSLAVSTTTGFTCSGTVFTIPNVDFTVSTGDVEVTSGNLGVGVAPTNRLDVQGTAGAVIVQIKNTQANSKATLRLVNDAQTWDLFVNTNDDLVFTDITGAINPLAIQNATGRFTINPGNLIVTSGTISSSNDTYWTGENSGLDFANISVKDNTTDTTLNSAAKVQFLFFDTNGPSNSATPDHTNDHITITRAGKYYVSCAVTAANAAGASHVLDSSVWKNNGTTELINLHSHRTLGAGTDIGSIHLSGIADLAASDTIELWLDTSRGSDTDVEVSDASLSVFMLGGT